MPKIDGTQLVERLQKRLDELRLGKSVAARDLRVLLTDEQEAAVDAAWAVQQSLRKNKEAKKKIEDSKLSWKTKREIHIEALESALRVAQEDELAAWERRLRAAEVRQARIYFDELCVQQDAGVDVQSAKTRANNALTRAGLRRLDGMDRSTYGLTQRDREIRKMEDAILDAAQRDLDEYDREQLELLKEHENSVRENSKNGVGRKRR